MLGECSKANRSISPHILMSLSNGCNPHPPFFLLLSHEKSIFLLVLLGCYVSSSADLTDAILSNRYAPKTLSAAYMDSVLNGKSDQRYQLRYENATTRFRHSKEADWYLQDTQKGKKIPIGRGREAQMSPNGRYVVYVKDRTPWIYKVDFQTEVVMTHEDSEQIYGERPTGCTRRSSG